MGHDVAGTNVDRSLIAAVAAVAAAHVPAGGAWCALGHDVAGTNVDRLTSLARPQQCASSCDINPACTQWIFVQTLDSGLQPDGYDCWLKRSSFLGRHGWSAAYQDDGYAVPDSAVACFKQLGEWRAFGRLLSE